MSKKEYVAQPHLLIEIIKERFSQACQHRTGQTKLHAIFKYRTILAYFAYVVEIDNMCSAAAVKTLGAVDKGISTGTTDISACFTDFPLLSTLFLIATYAR